MKTSCFQQVYKGIILYAFRYTQYDEGLIYKNISAIIILFSAIFYCTF